jgi:hypothetical protein
LDIGGFYPKTAFIPAFVRPDNPVIAGFNTDIELGGIVYHVQTEDKGAPANMIMTLVYDKGTILASKRSKYDDLAEADRTENEISDRLSKQHKLMCAAVKAGRINELVEMTRKSSVASAQAKAEIVGVVETAAKLPTPVPVVLPVPAPPPVQPVVPEPISRIEEVATPRPPINISIVDTPAPPATQFEKVSFDDLPVLDAEIIEDIEILPAEAVEVVSELSGKERTANQKLSLELLGDSSFKGGERKTVNLMICRGTDRKVVPDAQIMVKVLGSAFRPVIFHAKTDANGLAKIHLQLPHFQAGRAALLVRAVTGGEEIELRRIVTPG